MDIQTLALPGLIALGTVNVIGFFYPNLDSRIKFALSAVVAFGAMFIPADLGSVLADKIKSALEIALAASGAYKLASKAGGE